jgi:tRNA A-37 threonylcarbamoyl transferase component Bud32
MNGDCPSTEILDRLLANQLNAADEQLLEAHVAGCAACQERLEQRTHGVRGLPVRPVVHERLTTWLPRTAGLFDRLAAFPPARVLSFAQQEAPDVPRNAVLPQLSAPDEPLPHPALASSLGWLGATAALRAARRLVRRRFWIWPLIAAALLGSAGWWVDQSVENAMRQQRINELTTILEADVAALRVWMDHQRATAELIADDEQLRPMVQELCAIEEGNPQSARLLVHAPAQTAIRSRLEGPLRRGNFTGFILVSPSMSILAADRDTLVHQYLFGYRRVFFEKVIGGQAAVSKPFLSPFLLADANGEVRANLPCMYAAAPVHGADGKPIGALGLRLRPEDQFTRILQVARSGESGETYAFDRKGLLLNQSRFDEGLKQIGLLVDQPESQSILTVELRDPGVNLIEGKRPRVRRADQPLTRMAVDAVQGKDGHDADGYRDYRGVPVVGAWRWLEDHDIGVATEIDVAEALRPVHILRLSLAVLMGLLVLSAAGIFLATMHIARQQRALQRAALASRKLGQYTLIEHLGSGGMATVYKARHALLRRLTAVKLLNLNSMSDRAIARFEREVQLTSGLNHPNTVAIYDYGRTPEGIFYYVMEYLEGTNLEDLVTQHGPLPEARMVYLLLQVCGSLAEAHAAGLVHRDIKPANIFLTCRGGQHDFVKVLDFGLVKALDDRDSAQITAPNVVAGTPLYLSPEAVSQPDLVDSRADVYGIGAVGYFLLTGTPVFSGDSVVELCRMHLQATPVLPSARTQQPISPELEALLMRCLAKAPQDRPANAAELLRHLKACHYQGCWTEDAAADWWTSHGHDLADKAKTPAAVS